MLTMLEEIMRDIDSVTPEEIIAAEVRLTDYEPGERPLGVAHNNQARACWALAQRYSRQCAELLVEARYGLDRDPTPGVQRANRCDTMSDFVKELFWLQVREDIGVEAWYHPRAKGSLEKHGIGLRSGWMLVSIAPDPSEKLRGLLGRLGIPGGEQGE